MELILTNPIWNAPERRSKLNKAVQESAAQLESLIKQKILNNVPTGKTYRRGAIEKKIAKRDLGFFRSNQKVFKRKFSDLFNEKTVVGYKFHRASRKGQPPAVDSAALVNSIRARAIGDLAAKVASSKNYAAILDNKNKLDRPFFNSTAEDFRAQFKKNIAAAL